jgi:ABC-2 type transport system ATP-binding protein
MPPQQPAVLTVDLSKRFGTVTAVDRLNLSIPKGSLFGFIGPNGAGKTTTLRMLAGLLAPSSGQIRLLGAEVDSKTGRGRTSGDRLHARLLRCV